MKLDNIEALIDSDGQMRPVGCVAIANDESSTLAMLKRRPGESFIALLKRLDQAIKQAVEYDEFLDEVNAP